VVFVKTLSEEKYEEKILEKEKTSERNNKKKIKWLMRKVPLHVTFFFFFFGANLIK
jgi:hypothetical protein